MKKIKGRAKYIGLTMPEGLMLEVADFIETADAYRSKNEFVKVAIRQKLDGDMLVKLNGEIKELKKENKRLWKMVNISSIHQTKVNEE